MALEKKSEQKHNDHHRILKELPGIFKNGG